MSSVYESGVSSDAFSPPSIRDVEAPKLEAIVEVMFLAAFADGEFGPEERALSFFRKACGLGLDEGCLYVSPTGEERSPRE